MKNTFNILFFVLLGISYGFAQDPIIDSLKLELKNALNDTNRCNILNALIEVENDDKVWPIFNDQLLKLAKKNVAATQLTKPLKVFYLRHLADALNNVGFLAEVQGDIPKALDYYHKSLKFYEEIKDKEGEANSLNNIGFIYRNQRDLTKALEYYHKSLQLREEIKDNFGIANSLNNIGGIYSDRGDNTKALEFWHKSLELREELNDKEGVAYSLNNIGFIYQKQGDTPRAIEFYHKSLLLREKIQDKAGIANSLINIADAMLQKGLLVGAIDFATRSLQTAKELGYPENIKAAAGTLKKIYKKQNKYAAAFEMYELEIDMRDSINNEANKKASIQKQLQYEYEKKTAADSVVFAKENEIKEVEIARQKAEIKVKQNQQLALYGGLVLVIVFAGFMHNRFKVTQKQKTVIEQQKSIVEKAHLLLEEKNNEIVASIRYAKRIQDALLTSQKYMERNIDRLKSTNKI